jgi:hypothetical protein
MYQIYLILVFLILRVMVWIRLPIYSGGILTGIMQHIPKKMLIWQLIKKRDD